MSDRSDLTNGLVAAVIARGDSLARKGKYRRAIQVWRKLLDQQGDEVELAKGLIRGKIGATYFRLSRLALRGRPTRKAWLRAAERLRLALKYESHPDYHIELGRSYLKLGLLPKADETLVGLLGSGKVSEKALYYATVVKIRLGDLEGAKALIDRRLSFSPVTHRGWWNRLTALCIALGGDVAQALRSARTPYEGVPRSVWFEDVRGLARASTPSIDVFHALDAILDTLDEREVKEWASEIGATIGDILSHLGMDEEAVRYWTDAADGEVGHSHLKKVAATCEHRIVEAIKERSLDVAGRWYRIGIDSGVEQAIKPLESIIHFHLSKAAWMRADYATAASGFATCLRWKPSFELARYLALAYEADGDWAGAAAAWQSAYNLAPGDRSAARFEAARRQGRAWILGGEYGEAKGALQRALTIEFDEELAHYFGCIMIVLGDYVGAASHLVQATGKKKESPRLLVGLAVAVELAQRSLDEKVKTWERASRVSDETWVYRMWRRRLLDQGDSYLSEGRHDEALASYIKLLIEDLDDRECWVRCGAVHLVKGNTDKAEKCFREAQKGGDSAEIGRLIDAVKQASGEPTVAFMSWQAPDDSRTDEQATLITWARRQLQIDGSLDSADIESVLQAEPSLPKSARPSLLEFDQRLPVQRLLAYEPEWN